MTDTDEVTRGRKINPNRTMVTQKVEALVKKRPPSFFAAVMMDELFGLAEFRLTILTSNGLIASDDVTMIPCLLCLQLSPVAYKVYPCTLA